MPSSTSLRKNAILLASSAIAATTMLCAAPAANAAQPAAAQSTVAASALKDALTGVWVGPFDGFENNWHRKGFERLHIKGVYGASARGTWQFKDKASDAWSTPEPLRLVALPSPTGGWVVTGADHNGLYDGTLSADGTVLDLAYQNSGERMMAYRFKLEKQ